MCAVTVRLSLYGCHCQRYESLRIVKASVLKPYSSECVTHAISKRAHSVQQ